MTSERKDVSIFPFKMLSFLGHAGVLVLFFQTKRLPKPNKTARRDLPRQRPNAARYLHLGRLAEAEIIGPYECHSGAWFYFSGDFLSLGPY